MIGVELYQELARRLKYVNGGLVWTNSLIKKRNGTVAGQEDKNGYVRIYCKGSMVSAHRLIHFMHHGFLPEFIDHIDGDTRNNKIENLRAATIEQNARNAKTPSRNTSGRKGVYWSKSTSKWQASIRSGKKLHYLGVYNNFDDAVKAREKAEKEHHGEFARH